MTVAGRRSSVAGAFNRLASRRVFLFGGKGGVGKTTISTAAALHFAQSRPTVLFTTDPASNLDDIFPATGEQRPANLQIEGVDANALYARFLQQNLEQFLELGDRGTYLDKEELRRLFELSIPGIDELMAWMRIGELAEENPDAMVVIDTAPTGHTVRMLAAAQHFRQLGAALETMQAKHRDLVRQLTRRNVRDALDAFLEKFNGDAQRHRDVLMNRAITAFVPVMLSESWVVDQTRRLIDEVRRESIDVPFVVLNRSAPGCDCSRCRAAAARDEVARAALAPLQVFDAPRACMPLDTPERILSWLR